LYVPGNNGFISGGIHLAVGKALPGVDIGAAGFKVFTLICCETVC